MIELKNLTKRFGPILAVDGISLEVERGEVLGFLGPNGAGKSTTMKMVTGFLPPTSGTASVAGHDVTKAPLLVKRAIGYLPEGAPAYPDMTPESFLKFAAETRGLTGGGAEERHGAGAGTGSPRRRDAAADRDAQQGIQAARRTGPGPAARPRRADPGRADRRAGPQPEARGAGPDPEPRERSR